MYTREEVLRSPEYWFEHAQNELYAQVVEYMERKGLNQSELALELGVSRAYISQILKGNFNYTLKTLIEISLAIGLVPRITYAPVDKILAADKKYRASSKQASLAAEPRQQVKQRRSGV